MGQLIVSGLAAGSLYSLTALGLVLVYNVAGLVNFAHGEVAMFAAFVAYSTAGLFGGATAAVFLIGLSAAAALGFVIERVALRRMHTDNELVPIMATLGLFLILNSVAGLVWGYYPHTVKPIFTGQPLQFGNIVISAENLGVTVVAVVLMLVLFLFIKYSTLGVALRATAGNPAVARLMGINPGTMTALAWMIGSALGAVASLLLAAMRFLDTNMMVDMVLKAFTAAVLGGLGSLPAAIAGGYLLGVLENLVGAYISFDLKSTFAFLLIIVVLAIRPAGLLSAVRRQKV